MQKFGFPHTAIAEAGRWTVLVRPKQPTLGSLVLVCRDEATAFSDVSPEAFADLAEAVRTIERVLRAHVGYERINYLMLMMVDPDVHFHVIPRYEGAREHAGVAYPDKGWPGPPDLASGVDLAGEALDALVSALKSRWSQA